MIAEELKRPLLVFFPNEERDVEIASSIRNHSYGHVSQGIESFGFKTAVLPFQIAYHTDYHHTSVYAHSAEFLEFIENFGEMTLIVDGE